MKRRGAIGADVSMHNSQRLRHAKLCGYSQAATQFVRESCGAQVPRYGDTCIISSLKLLLSFGASSIVYWLMALVLSPILAHTTLLHPLWVSISSNGGLVGMSE